MTLISTLARGRPEPTFYASAFGMSRSKHRKKTMGAGTRSTEPAPILALLTRDQIVGILFSVLEKFSS